MNQIVKVKGGSSSPYLVTSGVVQGSRMGPIFFAVFIDDLTKVVNHSHLELFADDCRIIKIIKEPSDCVALQRDIDRVFHWIKFHRLKFNGDNCNKITFKKRSFTIDLCFIISNIIGAIDFPDFESYFMKRKKNYDLRSTIERLLRKKYPYY